MSGFGGFGGFGQQNNAQQQQNTGFGGFGQSTNTNTGMQPSFSLHPGRDGARLPATVHTGEAGAHSNLLVPTGFGASSTGTGFGSAQNNTGTSTFGGNTGGFGGSGGTSRMHHLFWLSRELPAPSIWSRALAATNFGYSITFGPRRRYGRCAGPDIDALSIADFA